MKKSGHNLQIEQIFRDSDWEIFGKPGQWPIMCLDLGLNLPDVKSEEHRVWQINNTEQHHGTREILFALRGECLYGVCSKIYSVTPGTILMINSGQKHDSFYSDFSDDFFHIWIHFNYGNAVANFFIKESGRIKRDPLAIPIPNWLADELIALWDGKQNNVPASAISSRLKILAAEMLMRVIQTRSSINSTSQDVPKHIVANACLTLDKHFTDGINLEQISRFAGYSKYHFAKIFKLYAGVTVSEYINRLRIKKVIEYNDQRMLKKEMAQHLGFSSSIAFSRWYRKNVRKKYIDWPDS